MITPELAYNLRFERGLLLPPDREYSTPRLKEIAVRQAELMKEMNKLDRELCKIVANDVDFIDKLLGEK